jgi:hypothetical protein
MVSYDTVRHKNLVLCESQLTVVILLGHGHRPQEVGRAADRLPLVLDEHLVHAHLLRAERSVAPVRLQILGQMF